MPIEFKPVNTDRWPEVARFLARIQEKRVHHPDYSLAAFDWKYQQPLDGWSHPSRSYILERDSLILAHVGIAPVQFLGPHGAVSSLQIVDWAASPDTPGAGMAIMRECTRLADTLLTIGGTPDALGIIQRFPGLSPAGDSAFFARSIRPLRILERQWQRGPRRFAKTALMLWNNLRTSLLPSPGWHAEPISLEQIPEHLFPTHPHTDYAPRRRSTTYLHYLARRPQTRTHAYLLRHHGRQAAFALFNTLWGKARLMDFAVDQPQDYPQALSGALQAIAAEPETLEIVTASNIAAHQKAFAANGLRRCGNNPVYLMDRKSKLASLQPEVDMAVGDLHQYVNPEQPYFT